jgi:hypothetical protein
MTKKNHRFFFSKFKWRVGFYKIYLLVIYILDKYIEILMDIRSEQEHVSLFKFMLSGEIFHVDIYVTLHRLTVRFHKCKREVKVLVFFFFLLSYSYFSADGTIHPVHILNIRIILLFWENNITDECR